LQILFIAIHILSPYFDKLKDFCGGHADMVGVDSHGFIFCGDDDGAAGKMVGFSEQASGTLLDSGNGCFIEDVVFNPCDGEVVIEVLLHLLTGYAFEVATSHDTGCQRKGGSIHKIVNQVGLLCQNNGKDVFGVFLKLGQGMQFCNHLKAQEECLINDQEHFHLFSLH